MMKYLDSVALAIIIVGGINMGLIGCFEFDLIAAIFGVMSSFTRIVYSFIGFSSLYAVSFYARNKYKAAE